jgi:hypothetical protein
VGTPDTASTKLNFTPVIALCVTLLLGSIFAVALNYTTGINIISCIYGLWAVATPIIIFLVIVISRALDLPLPRPDITTEFLKASSLIFLMILVISSFSIAVGTFTGPLVNLCLCIVFMFAGLMAPGLQSLSASQQWLATPTNMLPDFHVFWTAEMISLGHHITFELMSGAFLYAISMIIAFSSCGLYFMMRKDFS